MVIAISVPRGNGRQLRKHDYYVAKGAPSHTAAYTVPQLTILQTPLGRRVTQAVENWGWPVIQFV
jgi:hypothetical protein